MELNPLKLQGAKLVPLLQLRHLIHIQAVKGGVDLEEKDAEDKRCYQEIQGNSQFHHHRHAVGGAGGGEEKAVFHCQKTDYLGNGMPSGHHHQQPQHDSCQGDSQGGAGDKGRELCYWSSQIVGEDHQCDADQHRDRDVYHGLDFLTDMEFTHQGIDDVWQDNHFERQGQKR